MRNFNFRWLAVWQRNFNVWRKMIITSLLGNFGDPLIYLFALGYGLSPLIGQLDGLPYLAFLASGIVCSSAVNAASFEGLFSAYTRLTLQKTWEAMLSTPLNINDIVMGETLWAATKGLFNSSAILIVAALMGLVASWKAVLALPIILLTATCFAAIALIITSFAKNFDFFTYYLTLIITPMTLLSGVFFPIDRMPILIQYAAATLPLYHAVALIRPLMVNRPFVHPLFHLLVLSIYTLAAYSLTKRFIRRRLIE